MFPSVNITEKMGFRTIVLDIFPYLTVITLRKNPFYTLLSHVEPPNLIFWKTKEISLKNTCYKRGFGCFLTNWWTLFFGVVFGQPGLLALPNIKRPFPKNEDDYQKCGQPFFGTQSLTYFKKPSFIETPRTVMGVGIMSKTVSKNLAFWNLNEQMLILPLSVIWSS